MARCEIAALFAYVILGHLGILDNKRKENLECFHRVPIRFLSMVFGLEILMVVVISYGRGTYDHCWNRCNASLFIVGHCVVNVAQ